MRSKNVALALALSAAICSASAQAAQADDESLRSYLPAAANAVAVIDLERILNSAMGVREHWPEKFKNAYENAPLIVPPNARRVVLASLIDPMTLQPYWEISIMDLKAAPSMQTIARAERGFADTIADKPAVCSPINAYFVRLDSHLLGTVAPANRQFVARWIRNSVSHSDQVSPYLQTAMASADPGTAYLFAFDLADAACAPRFRRRIDNGEFECLADKPINVDRTSRTIASIKGLVLRVAIDEEISGSANIEFGRPTKVLADIAKPLLIEILGKCGAAVDDFNDWDCEADGNHIALRGKLSAEGMRRLFSIVDPPSPLSTIDPKESTVADADRKDADKSRAQAIAASKQYYAAVTKIIENIGKRIRGSSSMTQGAAWVSRDARRIERFPIVDVDPALVEWGSNVGAQLNAIAGAMGVGGLQTRARTVGIEESQIGGDTVTYYAGGTIGEVQTNENDAVNRRNVARQRMATASQEKAKVAQVAVKMLQEIEASRAAIRRAMTQKYQAEF